MKTIYDKLVRDNIPDIIRAQDKTPVVRVLERDEYRRRLNEKLAEEVREYLAENSLEELCDVLEVVEALAADMGYSAEDIRRAKTEKAKKNGGFNKRLLLEEVIE